MAIHDKQTEINPTETPLSADDLARANTRQINDHTKKSKHDRKSFLLLLLMFLIAAPIIVLLANSGFINRAPEPIIDEQPVSAAEIKEVETDLRQVINTLNAINRNPDLKEDHVEVKKVEVKPVLIAPAPVVVKPKQIKKQPEKVALKVEKPVIVPPVIIKPVSKPVEKPIYIKHDMTGRSLTDNNEQWACVHDTQSGLMWEVKAQDDAMRNANNLYTWFDPENLSIKGKADGGRCKGDAGCDTHAYVRVMNEKKYCGYSDWRLPTKEQMQTLVYLDNGNEIVKINKKYFPQTMPSWYWTASENSNSDELAWYVLFRNGLALNDLKERPKHIRLVRTANTEVSNR
jgi:hypothetical protein